MSGERTFKVLIVDDEKLVRDFFSQFFSLLPSVRAEMAEDGPQALEAARRDDFALVFLDMRMPKMSGWETFNELRKIIPQAAYVFMTGYAQEQALLDKIEQLGIICLRKPFEDLERIKEIINNAFQKSQVRLKSGEVIEDRRVYPRIMLSLEVDYMVKGIAEGKAREFRHSTSKDIALGGIRLLAGEGMSPGAIVTLVIKSPGRLEECPATGKVMWSKKSAQKSGCFDIGIKFTEIDTKKFAVFISQCAQTGKGGQ